MENISPVTDRPINNSFKILKKHIKGSMKLIITSIFTLLTFVGIADAQSSWVTHVGDNRISIKFPSEPKELTPGSFMSFDADSVAYIFTIVDFVKVAGIDSVAMAPLKATPDFAGQIKKGITQSLPDVDLPDFKIGLWKGFTSYSSIGFDSKKKKYDMFMFIIGNKLYSASTVTAPGVSKQGHDNFINSIMISN